MDIAGLQKLSLIDFPGRVSCVVFLTGCNFRCPYCHNPDLALGKWPQRIGREELSAFLEERRSFLDGVVFTGGEAALSPGLPDLIRTVRGLGLAVKLDTNGSRPDVLRKLIAEGLLDYIAMDIKTLPGEYGPPLCARQDAARIGESIRLIMDCGVDYEFRTTCVRPFADEAIVGRIARLITGARQYTLQTCRLSAVLDPSFFAGQEAAFDPCRMQRLQSAAVPWVRHCAIL